LTRVCRGAGRSSLRFRSSLRHALSPGSLDSHTQCPLDPQIKRLEDYGAFVEFEANGRTFTGLLNTDEAKVCVSHSH